jgi:tRNA uridine 5-carboxymethylaminomethyl modification enzyme
MAPWTPRRDEAYIGVLIDDLITNGTTEPYRMFTSRAEYRLHLREDNADLRLTDTGFELGSVAAVRHAAFGRKRDAISRETERLRGIWAAPGNALGREIETTLSVPLSRETNALDLLRRPELDYDKLMRVPALGPAVQELQVAEQVQIAAKYSGYLDRQNDEIERQRRHEETRIPATFDYAAVRGLSAEVMQKLVRSRPQTIGQAQRISGVTPAAISLLLVHLRRRAV